MKCEENEKGEEKEEDISSLHLPGHTSDRDLLLRAVRTVGSGAAVVGQQKQQQESLVEIERVGGGRMTAARSPRDRELTVAAEAESSGY